jgi:CheY-like chemotaxis protein
MILANKRILIVEDNIQNRVIYRIMMVRHGAQVEFDNWGERVVENMKAWGKFDAIVLDLMLPRGVSGFDVQQAIRTEADYAQVPIIAVSAADAALAIPMTQNSGFSGYIAKPINDTLFPQQIARIIQGEKLWYDGKEYHESP